MGLNTRSPVWGGGGGGGGGKDKPVHLCSLIRAFAIHILESIISIFYVYVAEQAGLSLAFSETLKRGFVATRSIYEIAHMKIVFLHLFYI